MNPQHTEPVVNASGVSVDIADAMLEAMEAIAAKAWAEAMGDAQTAPVEAPFVPQVHELPYFRFFKWMTTRALKRINPDTLKVGGKGCIIQQAYGIVADYIGGGSQAMKYARDDYEWSGGNAENADIFGVSRPTTNVWRPPSFDSTDARNAADRMIAWNDSGMYDHEKRALIGLAIEQELARRA